MSANARAELTPHMLQYDAQFSDSGETRWLPYIMYFHPAGYRSEVVNTDSLGFRYAWHGAHSVAVEMWRRFPNTVELPARTFTAS